MRDLRTLTLILALAAVVMLLAPAAALALDAAAESAAPAAQPSPSTPALTLTATPATVTAGDRVRLVVRLGIPDATVQLSRMRAGATEPTPVGRLVTGAGGIVAIRVTPRVTTTYRVDYPGDGALWSPASAEVTVSVRPRISVALADRVYRGRRARLGVTVRPVHPGAAVTVERWSDGEWTTWKDAHPRRGLAREHSRGVRTAKASLACAS